MESMTMNDKFFSKCLITTHIFVIVLLVYPLHAGCGNLPMVEKNVSELDSLNKSALSQIPGIPRDGTVDLKAYIIMDKDKPNIRIDEKKININNSTGSHEHAKPSPVNGVDVSTAPADGRIEYSEEYNSVNKSKPGGNNVR
jgi:hypothetical protein